LDHRVTANESSPYENRRGNIFTDWHQRRTALSSAAFLQDYLKPGMTLLDCGCGTGSISLSLAEIVAPGMVVGIDLDRERIERARTQALAPNLRFDVGDVYSLPFEEGSFDVVFANSVLEHLAEPNGALADG
jgi:ubiquinone/menaquinone biosynthesis C-methylase UbiE